jgi:hypothetical protein
MDNAMRCPPLAHRSAAAHKLHSARFDPYKIRESQNHLSGSGFSLFHPGGCPSYRDHRSFEHVLGIAIRIKGEKTGRLAFGVV